MKTVLVAIMLLGLIAGARGRVSGADFGDLELGLYGLGSWPIDKPIFNQGVTLGQLGRLDDAIRAFDRVLNTKHEKFKRRPEFVKAWVARGTALYKMKKLDEAQKCFDEALKINPRDPDVWNMRGNIAADQEAWNNIYEGISPGYDQTVALFEQALASARYRYSGPVAADIQEAMTAAVNDALQGVRTPEEALTGLQETAQQAIDSFEPA